VSNAQRRQRVLETHPAEVQALLVTTPANVRYLTGFTGSNGQLLLGEESTFFTDGRYDEQSTKQVPDVAREIYSGTTKFSELLAKSLADRGITRLGVEAAHMTLATSDRLRGELSGIELVPTSALVEKVRERKDADEVATIRAAQRLAEQALLTSLANFKGGTELDLALDIEWAARKEGAEGMSFETIVAGGAHAALPHASPRKEPIDLSGLLLIDMGTKVDGYCSDMTRTFLGPNPPAEMVKVHAAVCEAVEAAFAVIRPGVACKDVDAAARSVLEREGYGDRFIHSTGHGVGLEIHEGPTLAPSAEGVLEVGNIVTVEPGVYLPGIGGVRVEDFCVVTEDGYDNLTALDRGPDFPS
jgi:Xaa-Pro aminopeptidase